MFGKLLRFIGNLLEKVTGKGGIWWCYTSHGDRLLREKIHLTKYVVHSKSYKRQVSEELVAQKGENHLSHGKRPESRDTRHIWRACEKKRDTAEEKEATGFSITFSASLVVEVAGQDHYEPDFTLIFFFFLVVWFCFTNFRLFSCRTS